MGITLVPAYGRDYSSKAAVLAAFNGGHDFAVALTGQYVTRQELSDLGYGSANLRYGNLRKVVPVNIR